ncbi:conjugal transfer protein TraN [Novosphingobium olei]|uniref:conjugal transfer protein TraN n=1 Tax=Novosphingobium olei TaxID=2728851 RepID=UPI001F0D4447|nr:conjugal transfer protein TraN [Novosphingobium olei]
MPFLGIAVLAVCTLGGPAPRSAQAQAAAQAGEALGRQVQATAAATVTDTTAATGVPGYAGSDFATGRLVEDPEALASEGAAAASGSTATKVVLDPRRPAIDPRTIDLTAAQKVEAAPDSYLGAGDGIDGTKGKCRPLPGGSAGSVTYYESCNDGAKVSQDSRSCEVPLVATTQPRTVYDYTCVDWPTNQCAPFAPYLDDGRCRLIVASQKQICLQGDPAHCAEPETVTTWTSQCSEPVSGLPIPTSRTVTDVVTTRDESACSAATADRTCTLDAETCIDPDPATRTIDGATLTQACWKWRRDYTCTGVTQANDCGPLKANPACSFDHEECLDDSPNGPADGPCKVRDEVYRCTIGAAATSAPASLCGSDLYCLHGECTTITREASTEFQDALVAVHAMGDVRDQFDPADLSLFKGEATGCHRPIFGLVNCCAGKSSGLLSAAAGGAALAGGPAAIAALATPFLTQFLCSAEEKQLDIKDRMGLCHYVGTYCSQKVLFVCTTKRKSYCCFPSKLSRILQEQGRTQLGLGWGDARHPECRGFTVAEFQQLDLGKMDFREVYADFTEAVKLPDEVSASAAIQTKIRDYYQLHATSGP